MFRYLLISLPILFLIIACGGEQSNSATTTEANASAGTPVSTPAAPEKTHFEASHEAPYCKLWVVKFAAEVDDKAPYDGRWFDLKKDGTFETGQYQEKTNFGQWSIEKETNIIKLLFNSPEILPPNWKIQGAGGRGRIVWKGNVPGNPKGIQLMIEPETVKPQRQ